MTVTVVPIVDQMITGASLSLLMNQRLQQLASDLQDIHLNPIKVVEPLFGDVVIYISYNSKYTVRWRIVNDVPSAIEQEVARYCAKLGYLKWKTETVNIFKHNQ